MSGRPRILVIDDTEVNRALTARQLDKLAKRLRKGGGFGAEERAG